MLGTYCGDDSFAQGVQRAGADVAIDNPNAAERQRQKTSLGAWFIVAVNRPFPPRGSGSSLRHGVSQAVPACSGFAPQSGAAVI
jgi:hypothetical protein